MKNEMDDIYNAGIDNSGSDNAYRDNRVHILHGNRNSAKTTTMVNIISSDGPKLQPYSCTVEEAVYEDRKKTGYTHHVFSSRDPSGNRYTAVHKNKEELYGGQISEWGRFFVSEDAFSKVQECLLKDLEEGVRLFFIDEVGKMELSAGRGHYEVLKSLLQRKDVTIYITTRTQNLNDAASLAEQFGRSYESISAERGARHE